MTLPGDCASPMESIPVPGRREFLDELIEGLTTSEWRYLRDRLMQRHLFCDIFGKLPLEIALSVAAYLDPLDVVAMREKMAFTSNRR